MNRESVSFAALLEQAVSEPGIISSAYSAFHNYSFGNILLAAAQCSTRGIAFGPIATFPRWKALGRHVRRGEKALTLCQPVTIRRKADEAVTAHLIPRKSGPTRRGPTGGGQAERFGAAGFWACLAFCASSASRFRYDSPSMLMSSA